MSRILIVEDEEKIAKFVSLELIYEGYETKVVTDGRAALQTALSEDFDLILLDLMLPSLNGIEVLKGLRQSKNTPVIVLTARDAVLDKVTGLDVGANDYMTKPFAIEELLARMRVQLRKDNQIYQVGELTVDVNTYAVTYRKEAVELTKKEFDLLVCLLENRPNVVTRAQAVKAVWEYDYEDNTNAVDVFVRHLRTKIDDKYGVRLIETVRGVGYVIR